MTTAWDGFARVEYEPARRLLMVSISTIEPAAYREIRPGLAAMFVTGDPEGPPVFVSIDLGALTGTDLDGELGLLLGDRLAGVARDVIAGGEARSAGAELDVYEVADLAEAWAPYRAEALAGDADVPATAGRWLGGLWAGLRGRAAWAGAMAAALNAPAAARDRGGDGWTDTELPAELAELAGIEPELGWTVRADEPRRIGLRVRLRGTGGPPYRLEAGFDDGRSPWEPFRPDEVDPRVLKAWLYFDATHLDARIRIRAGEAADA